MLNDDNSRMANLRFLCSRKATKCYRNHFEKKIMKRQVVYLLLPKKKSELIFHISHSEPMHLWTLIIYSQTVNSRILGKGLACIVKIKNAFSNKQ